jgi:hypothetical protein
MAQASAEISKSTDLTRIQAFRNQVENLMHTVQTVERLASDLDHYKSLIEDINERYTKNEDNTQDHQLSWQILNNHILQFQKTLISLVGYINCNEYATPTEFVYSLSPLEWYRHKVTDDEKLDVEKEGFQRLLRYNPSLKFDQLSSDCEQTLALCVGEVVVLVGMACGVSQYLAQKYLSEQAMKFFNENREGL